MARIVSTLVITEAVLAVLLMAGVLIQTPKSSGLGGTIGGGGDGGGGGYRTRRGLERQIYWTTWVLVVAFLVCSIVLTALRARNLG
jgi:preprotein translocase subunit SecG